MIKLFVIIFLAVNSILFGQVINRMQFDRFTHYRGDDWITYAPARFITSIDIGDDYVYFGTRNGGILRYHMYDNVWDYPFTTSNGLSSNTILKIVFDADSRKLFAQTNKGIDEYNSAFDYWQPSESKSLPEAQQPDPNEMQDYLQHKNFNYPAYYRPGLSELPNFFGSREYEFRPPHEILDLNNRKFHLNPERIMDKFRVLWLSTDGLGPVSADMTSQSLNFNPQSLPNISPRDVFFDNDIIWIGGIAKKRAPAGITAWSDEDNTWIDFEAGHNYDINSDDIYCISGSDDFVFFGSENGLVRYNKKKEEWKTFSVFQGLESDKINDLTFFRDQLFIATARGFNWMSPYGKYIHESEDTKLRGTNIHKILALDSSLILASSHGLYEYNPETDKLDFIVSKSAIMPSNVTAVNSYSDSIWTAGNKGIVLYDKRNDTWRSFPQIQDRLNTKFHDIAFTEDHVWFACNKGLLKYDIPDNYWYLYTKKDGLASNRVYHIDTDGDNLWLSTDKGITIFLWYREDRIE